MVRPVLCAGLGAQPSGFRRGETGVSIKGHGAGIRSRTPAGREKQVCPAIAGTASRVCGARADRFVHCAGVGQRMSEFAKRGSAHIRAQYRQWVDCDPGGLVRVAEEEGSVVSMQRGGHSKDAWVLWDSPVDTFSMLRPRNEPVELRRLPRAVPSSVADNVFWLGRYAERTENIARILRAIIPRASRADEADLGCLLRLHSCLETRHSKLPKPKDKRPATLAELEQELISLVSDVKRGDSVASTLGGGLPHWRECS